MGASLPQRQRVLGGILVGFAILTTIALFDILGTVFFAITVAYLLSPARRWVRRRGVGRIGATLIITGGVGAAAIALIAPIAIVLFYRLDDAFLIINELPESIELEAATFSFEIVLDDVLVFAEGWLRDTAIAMSTRVPILLVKFALFLFVVFALVHNERDIGDSLMTLIPPDYRDIGDALHQRARDTLFAIYVLQGATAFATVLIALPVLYAFGYESWLALGTLAGILQFVPVIGPSLLIIALAAGFVIDGAFLSAILMLVVGGILIAAVPDVVIRPQLAKRTTKLSSVLYFVGFVGGLLTLGAIGVILGPLLIALLAETARLLQDGFTPETAAAN